MKPFSFCLSGTEIEKRIPVLDCSNSNKMKSGIVILKPGEDVGCHNTNNREELIIVLEGRAKVEIESKPFEQVESDSAVYIPPNTEHNIINNSDKTLRYIYVVSPVE